MDPEDLVDRENGAQDPMGLEDLVDLGGPVVLVVNLAA